MTFPLKPTLAVLALTGSAALALAQAPQQGMDGMSAMGAAPGGMAPMQMGPGCMMMGQGRAQGQMQGMGGMGMGGMGMGGMGGPMMGLTMEQRLIQLKTQLSITEAQSSAWEAYAKAATALEAAHKTTHETMMKTMQAASPVDRLDAHIKGMETMLASLKETKPALEALYSVLNDKQKQAANTLLGTGCMM